MRSTVALAVMILMAASATSQARTDRWTRLERIDLKPDGQPTATAGAVQGASISDDGRWVVFWSTASDLVAGDSNGQADVFVRDRRTGTTRRLSLRADGSQTTVDSRSTSASADGRFVGFVSADGQIVEADTNSMPDQFLLDRDSDGNGVYDEPGGTSIRRVSVNDAGGQLYNGADVTTSAISDRGTSVAFATLQRIAANDTNSNRDVYVRDSAAARTVLVSQSTAGVAGNGDSPDFFRPPLAISGDGARIAFSSDASNLSDDDTDPAVDVFVRDRDSDGNGILDEPGGSRTRCVSIGPDGHRMAIGSFAQFDLSRDGRRLAIVASDGDGENPHGSDVWVRELATDAISRIAFAAADWAKGGNCCGNQHPRISRGGEVVAFTSNQLYAFPGVATTYSDVFVKARSRELTRLTDYPVPNAQGAGYSAAVAAMSHSGAYLLISFSGAGATPVPEEGTYVYQRDTIFESAFEPF